ncbi:putative RDD family protein [Candidatus Desulfarcum epimagneticum]|uniref:Putative RDD family protein n=1 Tax=uncultured Desulfobacteraceae bacterium TaxID=218296 RepID=A0A484HGT9_9BACT|nr:putative RDD family protein [uncultured Desulfobacteraceae bacterium]
MQNPIFEIFVPLIVFFLFSFIIYLVYRNSKKSERKKYHTFWPRMWSPYVDAFILSVIWTMFSLVDLSNSKLTVTFLALIVLFKNSLGYFYTIYMHAKHGATVGKMICKVKIVDNRTEGAISFKQAILRDSFPLAILIVSTVWILTEPNSGQYVSTGVNPLGRNEIPGFVHITMTTGILSFIWILAELITMLTNSKRRALH